MKEISSVVITSTDNFDLGKEYETHAIRNQLINYFNIGVDEYKYPRDTILGDYVESVIGDLRKTGTNLKTSSYRKLKNEVGSSQAVFIIDNVNEVEGIADAVKAYGASHFIDIIYT